VWEGIPSMQFATRYFMCIERSMKTRCLMYGAPTAPVLQEVAVTGTALWTRDVPSVSITERPQEGAVLIQDTRIRCQRGRKLAAAS
jgi:hypothetical protein